MSEGDKRKNLRDVLDELDHYFEELEKDVQDFVRKNVDGRIDLANPFVSGFSMKMGPSEKPSIQFFGDSLMQNDGFRQPLSEQVLDEKSGTLSVVLDLPGVEKENIEISATERSLIVQASTGTRRYRSEQTLKAEVDPDSGKAECKNGVLQILFSLRDKSNKGARRVRVV